MLSAPELLMEAEQEIAVESEVLGDTSMIDPTREDDGEDEEDEELLIPGSFNGSNTSISVGDISMGRRKEKGGSRRGKTEDRAWGPADWRCLMGCLDKEGVGNVERVIAQFLGDVGLEEGDLEGEWSRSVCCGFPFLCKRFFIRLLGPVLSRLSSFCLEQRFSLESRPSNSVASTTPGTDHPFFHPNPSIVDTPKKPTPRNAARTSINPSQPAVRTKLLLRVSRRSRPFAAVESRKANQAKGRRGS
jgi:hypothetical protein